MAFVSSNLTSGFIDLATYDELEKYMYGGAKAITYFVRETRKSTWFTQVPTVLSKSNGTPDFGQEWGSYITRAGDYLLATWLRLDLPAVTFAQGASGTGMRWTRNFMHNLVREVQITFNDLQAYRLDHYFLDFWAAFTTPAGKQEGYNNMIGNISSLIQPVAPGSSLPAATLNLPLPVFYTRDSGVSLPTAALPYNEMRIQVWFRDWTELLVVDNTAAAYPFTTAPSRPATPSDISGTLPSLNNVYIWANYAIVSNDERKRMGCAPRDILIEQVQTAAPQTFAPATNPNPSYDIRFSHAIKVLFFSVKNVTNRAQGSVYTNTSPLPGVDPSSGGPIVNYIPPYPSSSDPILNTSLVYENTARLSQMGSDYYSLVQPWYQPNAVIPITTGYHMYSYSLDFMSCDPKGSTNYGKLTNVSMILYATAAAISANTTGANTQTSTLALPSLAMVPTAWMGGNWWLQTYQFVVVGVNNNVIRISGGSLGSDFSGKPRIGRCPQGENTMLPSCEPVLCY
jgi:hypothetical protein